MATFIGYCIAIYVHIYQHLCIYIIVMTGDVEEIEGSGQRGVTDKEMDDEDVTGKQNNYHVCMLYNKAST